MAATAVRGADYCLVMHVHELVVVPRSAGVWPTVALSVVSLVGVATAQPANAPATVTPSQEPDEATLADQLKGIRASRSQVTALEQKAQAAQGDNAWLLREDARDQARTYRALLTTFVDKLAGKSAGANMTAQAAALLRQDIQATTAHIRRLKRLVKRLRALRPRKRGDERFELDFDLAAAVETLDDLYATWTEQTLLLEKVAADTERTGNELNAGLQSRADELIKAISAEGKQATDRAKQVAISDAEKSRRKSEVQAARQRARTAMTSLRNVIALMKKRALDTAKHDQLIIELTGELNTSVLDSDVAIGLARRWLERGFSWIRASGPQLIFKVMILLLIYLISRLVAWTARRVVRVLLAKRTNASALLRRFAEIATAKLIVFCGLLVALAVVGINLTPVLAGLGIAGFIVGFALQDTLGNFASGMLILLYRPFDEGDVVETAGVTGTVAQLTLVSTCILTLDNQRLTIPNRQVWSGVIRNVFAENTRRVDLTIGVSYSDDLTRARAIIEEVLHNNQLVLSEPEPVVRVHQLGDSSVNFVVRPWTRSEDYWETQWSVTEQIKQRFDAEGVCIPFPQRDVHLYDASAVSSRSHADNP